NVRDLGPRTAVIDAGERDPGGVGRGRVQGWDHPESPPNAEVVAAPQLRPVARDVKHTVLPDDPANGEGGVDQHAVHDPVTAIPRIDGASVDLDVGVRGLGVTLARAVPLRPGNAGVLEVPRRVAVGPGGARAVRLEEAGVEGVELLVDVV